MSPRRARRHHCGGVDQVGTGADHTADQAEIPGEQDAGEHQLPGRIIARDDSGNWAFVSLTPLSVQEVPALAIARCSMVAIRYARIARACDRTLLDGGDPLRPDCPRLRSPRAKIAARDRKLGLGTDSAHSAGSGHRGLTVDDHSSGAGFARAAAEADGLGVPRRLVAGALRADGNLRFSLRTSQRLTQSAADVGVLGAGGA